MAHPSPLNALHEQADALFTAFGEHGSIVAEFEAHEIEYAALRKAAAVMDGPHRGLVEVTGSDRPEFLQRMVSGDMAALRTGETGRCFLLNDKGRITADLMIAHTDARTLIALDAPDAPAFVNDLSTFIFTEDVQVADLTGSHHGFGVFGPKAEEAIRQLDKPLGEAPVLRRDLGDVPGLELWVEVSRARDVWEALTGDAASDGVKPLGWQAFNIARIEAGMPLFHIDFGPTSLPHETGIVRQVCSFTKGCYRGQEIVARTESLGHPRKVIVGFRGSDDPLLPPAGAAVFDSADPDAHVVGAVTSSCHGPRLSGAPIGFAMVNWSHHDAGTALHAQTGQGRTPIQLTELHSVTAQN